MNNIIKCNFCNKVFIDNGTKICPWCKRNINDIFKDIFGKTDIFNEMFGGKE